MIRTFEEACEILGINDIGFIGCTQFDSKLLQDIDRRTYLYFRLRIISEAINAQYYGPSWDYYIRCYIGKYPDILPNNYIIGEIIYNNSENYYIYACIFKRESEENHYFQDKCVLMGDVVGITFKTCAMAEHFLQNFGKDYFELIKDPVNSYIWKP